jgi:3-oxoacyl-(acyl-carrier-protein) synthase/acyl carrier protein|tara:strand:+ start:1 stop:6111 length:6111 start_codon:yes stop_codon:yes gene_type:complete
MIPCQTQQASVGTSIFGALIQPVSEHVSRQTALAHGHASAGQPAPLLDMNDFVNVKDLDQSQVTTIDIHHVASCSEQCANQKVFAMSSTDVFAIDAWTGIVTHAYSGIVRIKQKAFITAVSKMDKEENMTTKSEVINQMLYTTSWEASHISTSRTRMHPCGPRVSKPSRCKSAPGHPAAALAQAQQTVKYGTSLLKAAEFSTQTSVAVAQSMTPCASCATNLCDPCVSNDSALFGMLRVLSSEARGVACSGTDFDTQNCKRLTSPKSQTARGILIERHGVHHESSMNATQSSSVTRRDHIQTQRPTHARKDMHDDRDINCKHHGRQSLARPIVVLGGSGGLGRLVSDWIARECHHGVPKLTLLSRSGSSKSAPREACVNGGVVSFLRCDSTSLEEASYTPAVSGRSIGMFLHSSGVLADAGLSNQTPGKLIQVSAPKSVGLARMYSTVLASSATDTCVLFSSISAQLGVPGQANYAAANAWLDGWVVKARRSGFAGAASIQWGAWSNLAEGGGMAANDASTLTTAKQLGMGTVTPNSGLKALETIIQTISTPVLVGISTFIANPFEWRTFLKYVPSPIPSLFKKVAADTTLHDARYICDNYVEGQTRSSPESASSRAERIIDVQAKVSSTVEKVLGYQIEPNQPLIDAGVDSLSMSELGRAIETEVGMSLPATVAFDYPTIADIAGFVVDKSNNNFAPTISAPKAKIDSAVSVQSNQEDLAAITGVGVRFAGVNGDDCDSVRKYWKLIETGGDAISVVPKDRWDVDTQQGPFGILRRRDPESETYSRHGSFVSDIDLFDCTFFEIKESDAARVDPQQRMILKVTADAMHTSGITTKGAKGSNTAVYVGICNNDHDMVLREQLIELGIEGKSREAVIDVAGDVAFSTYAFASNRISHVLGLVGASISVDCASASALVAVNIAVTEARRCRGQELRCVAASVNLILHRNLHDLHSVRNMFPHDGRCKTFDASADGFERGEGAGAIISRNASETSNEMFKKQSHRKSLEDNIVQADDSYADSNLPDDERAFVFVRGSATIHKGGGASLRALRGPAIQQKVCKALADADMSPDEVKYMEASGLGEPLGDAVEVGAYQAVFKGRHSDDKLIFGSVHTNIGHLDGCSGMASFIKTCLVTKQRIAPPIVHFKSLHSLIRGHDRDAESRAKAMGHTWTDVNIQQFAAAFPMGRSSTFSALNFGTAMESGQRPLCSAAVSSFGFGGTMAHVISDASGTEKLTQLAEPLCFRQSINIKRSGQSNQQRMPLSCEGFAMVENSIFLAIQDTVGPLRDIPRVGNFIQDEHHVSSTNDMKIRDNPNETSRQSLNLSPTEVEDLELRLRDRLGAPFLPAGIVAANPSITRLAEAAIRSMIMHQLSQGFGMDAVVTTWISSHTQRHQLEPERQRSSFVLPSMPKIARRVVFVLANPRSGSTLTQLVLNANPNLFAPQELYLLQFFTMDERRRRLTGAGLDGWILEGLRKAVMELRDCDASAASIILQKLDTLDTRQVYDLLQTWAGERIVIDKTPPYMWSKGTLQRAQDTFEDARYIFIYRHPLANISSMAKEIIRWEKLNAALDDLGDGAIGTEQQTLLKSAIGSKSAVDNALWRQAEHLWALGNANALDFLDSIPSEHKLCLSYEDLVTEPETAARAMCDVIDVPYHADMVNPYNKQNISTFTPACEGGLGAGDPHLLERRHVDPFLANAWRYAKPPTSLSPYVQHVARLLGYRLPMWKEAVLRSGTPQSIERLNKNVSGPVAIFIHDASGETISIRPLAERLPCAAFGVRVVPTQTGLQRNCPNEHGIVLPDETMALLASRYRAMTQEHLNLAEGDEVFYIGTGVLGSKIAQEMAAQQQLAADQQRSTGHVRSWDSSRGEPSVAGLLLLDAEGEIPRKSLAENAYALFAVARGEATSEMSAQADAVSFEEFERGLRKAHGHQSPLAALEYAEVFRRSSSQSEWDRRVDKALHTTRCGLKLAAEHVNKVKYTGSTLIVSSAEVRTRGIGDAKEAAHSPHVMREVRMDWHDSLALSHVDELANIIIAKLLG